MEVRFIVVVFAFGVFLRCISSPPSNIIPPNPNLKYLPIQDNPEDQVLSRSNYKNRLYGFWLAECIANWTGLVTEMDKIGDIGEIKTGDFYTRDNWGRPDQPNIWNPGKVSEISDTIDFVFAKPDSLWGADDDTDIEYMYQHLLFTNRTSILTGEQIRDGWLHHIKKEEENYLWVSNQSAFDLMYEGKVPPETGDPDKNPNTAMIDAQLTTEIFGLFAPLRPDIALKMSYIPIKATARDEAAQISEFYVYMHAIALDNSENRDNKAQIFWMAKEARKTLVEDTYPAKMYDYVNSKYLEGLTWESVRDSVYQRYQVEQKDGYRITDLNMNCNGCFAAGINYAASLVSLFYGEGDLKETIKIGTLCGWDSDNPTATWAGLIGFMLGKEGVELAFGRKFADKFHIHRTRQNFPNDGIDNFDQMSTVGVQIVDRVVQEEMGGRVDLKRDSWLIPRSKPTYAPM